MKFIYISILTLCFLSAQDCSTGYTEINNLCFYDGDLSVIQKFIDNSYVSNIDLGCADGDSYCGSPNPYMDDPESWFWKIIDGQQYTFSNGNGIVEPLELGIQEWENGRLTSIMCGAYIYCQLSGPIPEEINTLSEISTLRLEINNLSGFVPETLCDLMLNQEDNLQFDISGNMLCPPYPDCGGNGYTSEHFQETIYCVSENIFFTSPDREPQPISGSGISPVYPEIAREAGIEGTVYIQFFIDEKGNVTEAYVQKKVPDNKNDKSIFLDQAALNAVKRSKWKPARKRGKKIGVWETIPVHFKLK